MSSAPPAKPPQGTTGQARKDIWGLLLLSAFLMVIGLFLLYRTVFDPYRPVSGPLIVVVFVFLGLLTAAGTFGILFSAASLQGSFPQFGVTRFIVTGPAAIVVLFFLAGIYFSSGPPPFVNVVFHFYDGDEIIDSSGDIELDTATESRKIWVNDGRAEALIPYSATFGATHDGVAFRVHIKGFVVKKGQRKLDLPANGGIVDVIVVSDAENNATDTLHATPVTISTPIPTPVAISTPKATPTPVPSAKSVVDSWKLLFFDHFHPEHLWEVKHTNVGQADVKNDEFRSWCEPFDEKRYDVLERVTVAQDEHWQVTPTFLSERGLPMLNERWFQIMDDERWYAYRVRPK
jgi:hypothetical protein